MNELKYKATTKGGQVLDVTVKPILDLEKDENNVIIAEYAGKSCTVRFSSLNNIPSIVLNKYQIKDLFDVKINCDAQIALDRDYATEYAAFKREAEEEKKAAVNIEIEKLIQKNTALEIVSFWVVDRRMYHVSNIPRFVSNELNTAIEKAVKADNIKMQGNPYDDKEVSQINIRRLILAEKEYDEAIIAKKKESEEKKAAKLQAAKDEASRTGKDVVIESYSVDCDGSTKECSVDIITTFITPTGELKTERSHTY